MPPGTFSIGQIENTLVGSLVLAQIRFLVSLTDPSRNDIGFRRSESFVYLFGLVDLGGGLGFGVGPDLEPVGGAYWLRLRFNFESVLADCSAAANLFQVCFYTPQEEVKKRC